MVHHVLSCGTSAEALTSSWSTGEPGPIAYCVAEGMVSPEDIQKYNAENQGRSMIVSSGSGTHFMNSETFAVVLEQLYSAAFQLQRDRWDIVF